MIVRQAARLAVTGVAAGLGLAGVARPLAARMISSTDIRVGQDDLISPAMAAATALLLVGIVLVAAWLPARRAARIEPTLALKGQ
jgi:ABC-type lipoprotein release transport system permease subunit